MQDPSLRSRTSAPKRSYGLLVAFGAMTLSLVAGLACPGNLDPALTQNTSGAAGMGGPGGSGGGSTAGCDRAIQIMTTLCGSIVCHRPGSSLSAGLDLSSNQAAHLLGVASMGDTANGAVCPAGMVYLNPHTTPATGFLIDKLNGPGCAGGNQMPYLSSWPQEDYQCVIDWANSITAP
jgi:hypothetical protein